jgi:hypothetical protein
MSGAALPWKTFFLRNLLRAGAAEARWRCQEKQEPKAHALSFVIRFPPWWPLQPNHTYCRHRRAGMMLRWPAGYPRPTKGFLLRARYSEEEGSDEMLTILCLFDTIRSLNCTRSDWVERGERMLDAWPSLLTGPEATWDPVRVCSSAWRPFRGPKTLPRGSRRVPK